MPDEKFPTKAELHALFKEWEQDYALRRREDAHSRPTHPWPSEIAKTKRQPQPEPPGKGKGNDTGHSM
jgi:hypothetical protein